MNILVVVDMQKDFVSGVLGSKEAVGILGNVEACIQEFDGEVVFTRDTHTADYMNMREGEYLPVAHCIEGTDGWEICDELSSYTKDRTIVNKVTFGSTKLVEVVSEMMKKANCSESDLVVTLIGVCTDICVISNAMVLKANYPEGKFIVESACCAGVTPDTHNNALEAMKMCHIEVK